MGTSYSTAHHETLTSSLKNATGMWGVQKFSIFYTDAIESWMIINFTKLYGQGTMMQQWVLSETGSKKSSYKSTLLSFLSSAYLIWPWKSYRSISTRNGVCGLNLSESCCRLLSFAETAVRWQTSILTAPCSSRLPVCGEQPVSLRRNAQRERRLW